MTKMKIVLVAVIIVVSQGCATLSKSECREADWRIIGLEDGSLGRPVTYIGRHRESCADHGVKPNLSEYQQGHADGIRLFCTPRKGFELGRTGRDHNNVCPADLSDRFLHAYADGLEIRAAQTAVMDTQNRLKAANAELEETTDQISYLETQLVNGAGVTVDRQNWLAEIKRLQVEKRRTLAEIYNLEHEVADQQSAFENLASQFQY